MVAECPSALVPSPRNIGLKKNSRPRTARPIHQCSPGLEGDLISRCCQSAIRNIDIVARVGDATAVSCFDSKSCLWSPRSVAVKLGPK